MNKSALIIAMAAWTFLAAGATGCKRREDTPTPAPAVSEHAAKAPPVAPTPPAKAPPPPQGLREILLEGRKAFNEERLDQAAALFTQAAELAPTSAEPLVDLGRTWVRQGAQGKALVALSRAVELNPEDAFALLNLGHLLTLMGDEKPGLDHLRKAAALKPRHPAILCGLVLALKKAGKADDLAAAQKKAQAAGSPCPHGKDPFASYGDVKPPK